MMRKKYKPYIMLMPFLCIMAFIFITGLINGIVQSLGYMPFLNMNTFTLKYYAQVIRDGDFVLSLLYSIYISMVSSVISVVLGIAAAFSMLGLKREHKVLKLLYHCPIIIPHLVAVILIFSVFSQSGILSRIVYGLGLINEPNQFPLLVQDTWGIGIILVYLFKQVPFVTMTAFAVLSNINEDYKDVAYNLGASRVQVIFKVVLPLLMPTILSVFLIVFAFTFGAFEVPFLIGNPAVATLPVKSYIFYTSPDFTARPYTMVINVIISVISICFTYLYVKAFKYVTKYSG